MARFGPIRGERAVDSDGEHEEGAELDDEEWGRGPALGLDEGEPEERGGGRHEPATRAHDRAAAISECDDEAGQVDGERADPDQRRGDEVRLQEVGRGGEQAGGDQRGEEPEGLARYCDRGDAGGLGVLGGGARALVAEDDGDQRGGVGGERDDEQRALRGEGDGRLDDERVGEEGEEAGAVGDGEEPPRIAPSAGVPGREQRRRRREQEGGGAADDGEGEEDVERGRHAVDAERGDVRGRDERERDGGDRQHELQHAGDGGRDAGSDDVGVDVAQEEHGGEEAEAGGPDGGCAAKYGKDEARGEQLQAEEQERREADDGGE